MEEIQYVLANKIAQLNKNLAIKIFGITTIIRLVYYTI